ncbi:DNA-binding protein [Bordetella sp. N]|nr:DNA-binding protein [Bordetella sp. N]
MLELSFDVGPVVSVVRRHVKLSKQADEAIRSELADMLNHAVVQLRLTEYAAETSEDDPVLTTEKAAQLAGVSRPYMVKLIDSGVVQLHQKVGNQRRVLRSAIIRWQAAERKRQASALKRLAKDLDQEIFSS